MFFFAATGRGGGRGSVFFIAIVKNCRGFFLYYLARPVCIANIICVIAGIIYSAELVRSVIPR